MLVVGIWKAKGTVQRLPARDTGIVERNCHLLDEVRGSCRGGFRSGAAIDEFSRLVKLEFFEDGVPPRRAIEAQRARHDVAEQNEPSASRQISQRLSR